MNRFASIRNTSQNQQDINRRRMIELLNNNIRININNYSISCNYNKMKLLVLIVITFIMSLSNIFYNNNYNDPSIIEQGPRFIFSLFGNKMLKINLPFDERRRGKLRNLIEEDKFQTIINDKERISLIINRNIKRKILNDFGNYNFKCNWESVQYKNNSDIYIIGETHFGEGLFNIKKKSEFFTGIEYFTLIMKNNEGNYIDNWIIHSSFAILDNIFINKNKVNNTFEITGNFETSLFKGNYFNILNQDNPDLCKTKMDFSFPLDNQISSDNNTIEIKNSNENEDFKINLNNFSIVMESSCGFKFKIRASVYEKEKEGKIIKNKINIYCLISIFSSILYIISVSIVIFNMKRYETIISSMSIDCLSINPIWNTYVGLANINISTKFQEYFNNISLIVILSGIKFLFVDFRLLTIYWNIRRTQLDASRYLKERIRFYFIYYLFIFSSFFLINSFFLNYFFIMILCILLWVPQIIFNIRSRNKYSYPFIYILSTTFDKLFYPVYFRGVKNNFLMTRNNPTLIIIMVLFVVFTIIIMYVQILKEPRFMFPGSSNYPIYDFFRTKKELLSTNNNIGSEECVICLLPIFSSENEIMIEMEDKSKIIVDENKKDSIEEKINIVENKEDINLSYNDTYNSSDSHSVNSELERIEDNEINDQNNSILSTEKIINNEISNKNDKKKNFDNKTKIRLVEEEEIEENKEENNLSFNPGFNTSNNYYKDLVFKKIKIFFEDVFFIFNILFNKNFFVFYKKPLFSEGKPYMLTPCNHVFHSECLEKWLEYKKECPNCRKSMEEYLQ